ncbi:MAG: bifunctional folylpolyglutamate synthase/dihydrofolate synthase [Deltaproteobacteria bacterium]|nr:bifunctional folylpolyglutamate synthase/dihydrofolate synthase [Deltaproteobacteria bacterium]
MTIGYAALLDRWFAARRAGVVFELGRIHDLFHHLGDPDRALGAVVHVGGTNGKGSTAAMIAAIARAAGRSVGVYTSPHLATVRERVTIDGALCAEAAWCAAAERVWAAGGESLTFFEQVTAVGVLLCAERHVDVAVFEVGLGGRLDATNAIHAPPVAVVTGVAMDHQDYLGDTLEAIADEKAGIWKPGQRIVIGASGEPAAVPRLIDRARAVGAAAMTVIDDAAIAAVPTLALAGAHQRANAAAALAAIDHLEACGALVAGPRVRAAGLATTAHPGRLETLGHAPRLVVDGAHNPHGARALGAWLAAQPERPRALVLAVSADKDIDGVVAALAPHVERVIATRYDQARALAPVALAERVRAHHRAVTTAESVPAAIAAAEAAVGASGLVVVAGSLFAVGEARVARLAGPVDPRVVTDPVGVKPT